MQKQQDALVNQGKKAALRSKTIIGAAAAFVPSAVMVWNATAPAFGSGQVDVPQESIAEGVAAAEQTIDAALAFWTSLVASAGAVYAAYGRLVAKESVTITGK